MKIPASCFLDVDHLVLKFIGRQTTQTTNSPLKEKNQVREGMDAAWCGATLPSYSDRGRPCQCKNTQIDTWNEIEPETHPHDLAGWSLKRIWWRTDSLFNKWCRNNWILTDVIFYKNKQTKPTSKWVMYLNVKHKTIKFLERNRKKLGWPWLWWWPRFNTIGMIHEINK